MQDLAAASSAFTQLAAQLDMLDPADRSDPVAAVHAMLAARPDWWLLIFDDVTDADALDGLLPASANGDVLVTSRNPRFGSPDIVMRVPELDMATGADILLQRTQATDRASAERLAAELGGLPLALEQVATFVGSSLGGISLAEYLRLLRQRQSAMLGEGLALEYVPQRRTVEAVFMLALDRLTPEARALISLISCFAPERIPMSLLAQLSDRGLARGIPGWRSGEILTDPVARNRAVAALVSYSLVQPWREQADTEDGEKPDTETMSADLSIHRLIREVAMADLGPEDLARWRFLARGLVDRATPDDPEDPSTWLDYDLLIPHIRATTDTSAVADDGTYWRAATFLERHGDSRTACIFWRDIADAAGAAYGDDDPRTLAAVGNLAVSLAGAGSLPAAAELEQRVLEARRRGLGENHRHTLTAMGNLAIRLAALGDLTAAAALERVVLNERREILGASHPDTLTAMGNLAIRLAALGDLTTAVALEEQVLSETRALGDRTASLRAMANLAATLAASGDLATAVSLEKEALNEQRGLLGDQHPYTLQAISNLASHLTMLGAGAEAESLVRPVVDDLRRLRGAEHPDTLAAMATLAVSLAATGDIAAAIDWQRRVLEARRRTLGNDHPDTYRSMGNLAISLGRLGAITEVLLIEREVLAGFESSLGPDHIDTYTAKANLAASLAVAGNRDEALRLERQVLAGYERILGADHPQTRHARANIARLTARTGNSGR